MSRRARWAGRFYPGRAGELERELDALLGAWPGPAPDEAEPWGLLVPHAGYPYSGRTAAAAYAQLRPDGPRRVFLIGPCHHAPVARFGLSLAGRWETPLGDLDVDLAAVERLLASGAFSLEEEALALEHSLEVQLPFLRRRLPGCRLVPIGVGHPGEADRHRALAALAVEAEPRDLWLVTTDLSHFHPRDMAEGLDAEAARLVEAMDVEGLSRALGAGKAEACGAAATLLLLEAARRRGARARILDRTDSSASTGDEESVVGYLAAAFYEGDKVA